MTLTGDLALYGRFVWGLPGFLRQRTTLEETRAVIRQSLERRDERFLHQAERSIFGHPASPYRALLRHAGYGLDDLRHLVQSQGLEGALGTLLKAGVYVGYEEFKGRAPIVRGSLRFTVEPGEFDNPATQVAMAGWTSGATGGGTRVLFGFPQQRSSARMQLLGAEAHGMLGAPMIHWGSILPNIVPMASMMRAFTFGQRPIEWFTPIVSRDLRPSLISRLATWYIVGMARASGFPFPWPQPVRMDRADIVARAVAATLRARGRCVLHVSPSLGVRVSVAAREAGLDLSGALFSIGGEPVTQAKVDEIVRCGARWCAVYAMMEVGWVGNGCARPLGSDDVHFARDRLALIQHPWTPPGRETSVDAIYLTSLDPTAPKIAINLETGDYGIFERRACGCRLGEHGFTDHLRQVRSYRKLTSEGVTLAGIDIERILQEALPARFGGSAVDYQLVEEEDRDSLTRLSLLVSPRVALPDEAVVVEALLRMLRQAEGGADQVQAFWRQAGALRVKRQEPIWNAREKLLPLHLAQRRGRATDSPREVPATKAGRAPHGPQAR